MNKLNVRQYNFIFALEIIVLVIGGLLRLYFSVVHFTHVDDAGYLADLLVYKNSLDSRDKWYDFAFGTLGSGWTYAPIQAMMTVLLLKQDNSYIQNLFLGRFVSLTFGIVAVILLLYIVRKVVCQDKRNLIYLAVVIFATLSWEEIIYSAQAEPYTIGIVFVEIILLLIVDDFAVSPWKSFVAGVLFAVACFAHYQMFIVVFAAFVAMFFLHLADREHIGRLVCCGVITLALVLPLLANFFERGLLNNSLNWNIGNEGQFLFDVGAQENVLTYIVKFWITNCVIIFKYFFGTNIVPIAGTVTGCALCVLFVIGVAGMHKQCFRLALFQDILLFEIILMVVRKSLSLGPSRHMLFLYPIMLINIALGIKLIVERISFSKIFIPVLLLGITVLFIASVPGEISGRKNLFYEQRVSEIIKSNDVQYVFASGYGGDISLANIEGYESDSKPTDSVYVLMKCGTSVQPSAGDKILVMTRGDSISDIEGVLKQREESEGWTELSDFMLVSSEEYNTGKEIEYASSMYENGKNQINLYILEF